MTVAIANRSTLKDWEAWLAPQVRQVELLGEIPITADECAQLGQSIRLRLKTMGMPEAVRIIRRNYRCAFAAYLVAQGIYGYQGGDYWSQVCQATGLASENTWRWGQLFEEILEELGLPMFYDMREEAHRYVSLILAHGGIPSYCLPDFFANMLQPSVRKLQYADISAPELIDEWRWRSSAHYFTDKPVIRFLIYGERVAQDFVERCRDMARETLESGLVPEADQVGLPTRVVEAYRQWIAEQGVEQVQRESGDKWRLRKPGVRIDPWGEGVILDLPPQQVPATEIQAEVAWRVQAGGRMHTIPVHVRRTGFDWKTTAESLPLTQPAGRYEVSLLANGQVKNSWRYQGVDENRPLLAFDLEQGTLLRLAYSLPARRLGILYPARSALSIEGEADRLEEWPRLPWGWANFQGQAWDLSRANRISLTENGKTALTVLLRPDEAKQQPTLEGGSLLSPGKPGVRAPVYVGPPPGVRIPLAGRRGLDEEMARWRVTVQNKWAAEPRADVMETLLGLSSCLAGDGDHVDLLLCHQSLLGETPFGSYDVRLRGPLGRGDEFALRVVPHLVITGHEETYLPDPRSGPQPVTLLVEALAGDRLEGEGEGGSCRIEPAERHGDRWEYQVEVDPDATGVELTLVRALPGGDIARVPVTVPIRRLRWALVTDQGGSQRREWTGRTIPTPVDALLQSESPCLLVELPLSTPEEALLGLGLVDVDGAELQSTRLVSLPTGQRLLRFELAAFLDTIRASRSPVLRLELKGFDLPGQSGELRWPVLSLAQSLIVQDVAAETQERGGVLSVTLRWREQLPLRNRCLRLWSLWRPWQPGYERAIPDGAEGMLSFDAPASALPLGKYRLEFFVVDPWVVRDKPVRPEGGAPSMADLELVSAADRQSQLTGQIRQKGPRFDLFLERAHLRIDLGDLEASYADQTRCYERLDEGTLQEVLVLRDLMVATGNTLSAKALQMKMLAASRMEQLVQAYKQGEVTAEDFRRYLTHLPKPDLWPQKTCEVLLAIGSEVVQLRAAEALVSRSNRKGIEAVLRWVAGARLSDADAVALMSRNPEFCATALQTLLPNSNALRLLRALSKDLGEKSPLVQAGTWLFCDAGWGRIERIEDAGNQPVDSYLRGQTGFRLYVILRPSLDAKRIVVDLSQRRISFPGATCLYVCTKCENLVQPGDRSLLRRHSEIAHPNTVGGAAFRIERAQMRILSCLQYSTRAPAEQLSVPEQPQGFP